MKQANKPAGLDASFNAANENTARKPSRLTRLTRSFLGVSAITFALMGNGALADDKEEGPPDAEPVKTQPAAVPDEAEAKKDAEPKAEPKPGEYVHDPKRTVRLLGPITDTSAVRVIEQLLKLSKEDPKADIELRINSPGGSVPAGLAIYDVMKSLPNDIRTVCEGQAQSMGAFLLSAGTQGKRFSYPNCTIMYHQPSWGVNGQITDMEVTTSQGQIDKERMIEIIAEDSGWPVNIVRDLLERNFYPDIDEAKEMGFIDHIIGEKKPDAAPAPKKMLPDGFCDNPGRKHMRVCNP